MLVERFTFQGKPQCEQKLVEGAIVREITRHLASMKAASSREEAAT